MIYVISCVIGIPILYFLIKHLQKDSRWTKHRNRMIFLSFYLIRNYYHKEINNLKEFLYLFYHVIQGIDKSDYSISSTVMVSNTFLGKKTEYEEITKELQTFEFISDIQKLTYHDLVETFSFFSETIDNQLRQNEQTDFENIDEELMDLLTFCTLFNSTYVKRIYNELGNYPEYINKENKLELFDI